jgi:hypothetical protein
VLGTDAGLTAEHLVKANPKRRWFQIGLRTPLLVLSVDPYPKDMRAGRTTIR